MAKYRFYFEHKGSHSIYHSDGNTATHARKELTHPSEWKLIGKEEYYHEVKNSKGQVVGRWRRNMGTRGSRKGTKRRKK